MTANGYQRLPGGLSGFVRRSSAWAGEDHLLLISGTRYKELYQRVYYSDILAVIVQRTERFTVHWAWFVGVFILFIVAVFVGTVSNVRSLLFSLCGIALVLQLVLAFGFSCHMVIATAVGNVAVRSVARRWEASRFVKKLAPRIQAVQLPAIAQTEAPPQ